MSRNFKDIVNAVSRKYHNHPNLIGILWIGSSSFGIKDNQTDIDIRLLVSQNQKQFPMQQFQLDGIEIEIDEMSWQWLTENDRVDSEERWIREKGVILFDPKGKIAAKFKELATKMKAKTKRELWESFKSVFYSNDIEKCLKRDDKIVSSLYFFTAVDNILRFIFLYKEQPVPPFKWRWYFLTKNRLLSKKSIDSIKEILLGTRLIDSKLKLLYGVEREIQQLTIKKGYKKEQVLEHWRF